MKIPIGLYIHVPFCLSKCPYCDFYSQKFDDDFADDYANAVCRAIEKSPFCGRGVDTVYFGGGTPVLLGAERLGIILGQAAKSFKLITPEITLEANPAATLTGELAKLRGAGFNRVSFGVQSAIDGELKALGRLHTAADARGCILAAYEAGFNNISADLMLCVPEQTPESLCESIDFISGLPIAHVSAYMLKIEGGTPFSQLAPDSFPDEDTVSQMYLDCVQTLAQHGFEQYEISNFAKNSAGSRHNLKYWRCEEYLGIGPSAHSFMDGKRFYLPRDTQAFVQAENPMLLTVPDGEGGGFEEYAMLRLRLCEGLNLNESVKLYGAVLPAITKKARKLEQNGLLTIKNGVVSLTPKGFLLSNSVIANLLYD